MTGGWKNNSHILGSPKLWVPATQLTRSSWFSASDELLTHRKQRIFPRLMIGSRDFFLGSEVPDFRNRKIYRFPEVAPAEGLFLVFSMSSCNAPFLRRRWGHEKVDIETERRAVNSAFYIPMTYIQE